MTTATRPASSETLRRIGGVDGCEYAERVLHGPHPERVGQPALTPDHLAAGTLFGGGTRNDRAIELMRGALESLERYTAECGDDAPPVSTYAAASLFGYQWGFGSDPRGLALSVLGVLHALGGFVTREQQSQGGNYLWTRGERPAAELDAAAAESIERTWIARNRCERPNLPGERVAIIQPKVYGTGPSDTETTMHFGTLDGGAKLPGDTRQAVRIDSADGPATGALILYPGEHVFRLTTRRAW